jgi:putative addiction module component (TIGR02574 family)
MNPEVKYRLIERLIQIEDDELLNQVQEILDGSDLSEEEKLELDKRVAKYQRGESKLYTLEEVKERIQKRS